MAIALEELSILSAIQGDGARAVMLFGSAHAQRERMGAPVPPVDRAAYDSAVAASRSQLGETAYAAARPFQVVVGEILKAGEAG
jgi:hypothetical protein